MTCCPRCCGLRWMASGSAKRTWTISSRSWSLRGTRPPGSPSPRACSRSASIPTSGTGYALTRRSSSPQRRNCCAGRARPTSCAGRRQPTPNSAEPRSGPATRSCSGTSRGTGTRPSSPTPTHSTSPAPPTGTSALAAAGPTPAAAPPRPGPRALARRGATAAATNRTRPVAGAIITPLRPPLVLAKDLATLDRLSRGRLVVQPTVGWHRDEYDALGIPFELRGDILDEQLEVWSRAWSGSPVSFGGRHYRFGDVWVEPQPFRPGGPPLWFGGSTVHQRVIERVVRYGSGFNPLGRPEDAGLARLAQALISAGPGPAEIQVVGGTRGTFPGPDKRADLDQARDAIPATLTRGVPTTA